MTSPFSPGKYLPGLVRGKKQQEAATKKLIVLEALEVGAEVVESARSFESRLSHPQT
jgi:hypothetical protein